MSRAGSGQKAAVRKQRRMVYVHVSRATKARGLDPRMLLCSADGTAVTRAYTRWVPGPGELSLGHPAAFR